MRYSEQEGTSSEQPAEPVGERPDQDAQRDAAQRGREARAQVQVVRVLVAPAEMSCVSLNVSLSTGG